MTIFELNPVGSVLEVAENLPADVATSLARGDCPDCLASNWRMGPRGGMSQNIECRNCLRRFNVAVWKGLLMQTDRLPSEADGGSHWREDWFPK